MSTLAWVSVTGNSTAADETATSATNTAANGTHRVVPPSGRTDVSR
jgi:hypothetical protein